MKGHRSEKTLARQARVLDLPIQEPLYYVAQEDGQSHVFAGSETNRQQLEEGLALGRIRKVLVKYDVPVTAGITQEEFLEHLQQGVKTLLPYYDQTKD